MFTFPILVIRFGRFHRDRGLQKLDKEEKFNPERLRNMRKEAGITQKELGDILGLSRETILHIENGAKGSIDTLEVHVIRSWYIACEEKICQPTKDEWAKYIKSFFGIV